MQINVLVADASHVKYADEICEEVFISARERGTGIARRTPEYVAEKMLAGKAVIAIAEDGRFAGFSYIETWGGKEYVANSGLIVSHAFRGLGLAMRIKTRIFELSREKYPNAKIYSLLNSELREEINESSSEVCKHYGVQLIELYDIEKQNGHPSIKGMQSICNQLLDAIK